MRWAALLLQVIFPGAIGLYLAYAMALGLPANPTNPPRDELLLMIIFGGAVIGFLAWLLGLIADRISLIRLVLTVITSMLGLTVSFLLIEVAIFAPLWVPWSWAPWAPWASWAPWAAREPPVLMLALICAALATPLAGAMAGYYWLAPAMIGTPTG
jgi:hypothetical protein